MAECLDSRVNHLTEYLLARLEAFALPKRRFQVKVERGEHLPQLLVQKMRGILSLGFAAKLQIPAQLP